LRGAFGDLSFERKKNIHPAEVLRHLVEAYGEGVMNEGDVRKLCPLFNGQGQMRAMKGNRDARLSSPRI
jgi:hypothetical protein